MPSSEIPSSSPLTSLLEEEHYSLDLSVLEELIGDNKFMRHEFICKFIASARKEMAEIESALERQDCAALCTLGHHNKSPARMVGAIGFANLCQALEEHGENGDIGQALGIASQMRLALDRIDEQVGPLSGLSGTSPTG